MSANRKDIHSKNIEFIVLVKVIIALLCKNSLYLFGILQMWLVLAAIVGDIEFRKNCEAMKCEWQRTLSRETSNAYSINTFYCPQFFWAFKSVI